MSEATLDISGTRVAVIADDDDFKVVTFYVPFDPTVWSEWTALVKGPDGFLTEWQVTPSGDAMPAETVITWQGGTFDVSGHFPVVVDVDTSGFGAANRVWCVFANKGTPDRLVPVWSGRLTTRPVLDEGAGS